jgi:hypothetical protein
MRRIWLLVLLAACSSEAPLPAQTGLVFLSDGAQLPAGCTGTSGSTLYPGAAVEPILAADPRDPLHFCAAWQQDRFSDHGAAALLSSCSFDGGHTWVRSVPPPFSRCTGGTFDRASDPWISIGPDGTVHFIALAFDEELAETAVLAVRSTDGGRTWSAPATLLIDDVNGFSSDKEAITADPNDARFVYAVWDRPATETADTDFFGPAWFARSTDGGASWEQARVIYDPGEGAQTLGNQIVALPGGRLVDVFVQFSNPASPTLAILALVSDDQGSTWSSPIFVGNVSLAGVTDTKNKESVRSGGGLPSVAADTSTGELYVVWEDATFNTTGDGIVFSRSADGGATWSRSSSPVNGKRDVQAFTPSVSAAAGVVAVSYYDLRDDIGEPDRLRVTHWLATSADSGETFTDSRMSQPFDLQLAAEEVAGTDRDYFLGDYTGLVNAGGAFFPLFVVTGAEDRSDIVFRPAH